MLLAHWHPSCTTGDASADDPPFTTHLHGRELLVRHDGEHRWHWCVTAPHGELLAEGDAPTRDGAEQAAEDEATAVHPPTEILLEVLLR